MKKIVAFFTVLLLLLPAVSGCAKENANTTEPPVEQPEPIEEPTEDELRQKDIEEYDAQIAKGGFRHINYQDYNDDLDPENGFTGLILLSRNNCPWCQRLVPILMDYVLENSDRIICYLDTNAAKTEDTYDEELRFNKIVEIAPELLTEAGSVNDDDEPAVYVPMIIVLKDGQVIGIRSGVTEDYNDLSAEVNEEQIASIKNDLDVYFAEINQHTA